MSRLLAALVSVGLLARADAPQGEFADVTKAVGVAFTHANSATSSKYLVETMGGGVALVDYDNDGRLDIFFTNGARIDDPMPDGKRPDKTDQKFWNRLYHQTADGRRLFIKAVNTDLEHPVSALITLRGARVASTGTLERVHADSLTAANSFRTPDAVRVTTRPLSGSNALALVLPSHSVSVITLDLLH